jgi:hypothetical protein
MATRRDVWIIEQRDSSEDEWEPIPFHTYARMNKCEAMRESKRLRDCGNHARVTQYIAIDEKRWRNRGKVKHLGDKGITKE